MLLLRLSVRSYKYCSGGVDKLWLSALLLYRSAMVTRMNEEIARKPCNVLINPDALHEARVEALRARKSLGQWIEDAIEEKIEREEKKLK